MRQPGWQDLVFDIETSGAPWEDLPASLQSSLIRKAKDGGEELARSQLGLSPTTGRIVCIAFQDVQEGRSAAYVLGDPARSSEPIYYCRTEREILEEFYRILAEFRRYVTYNGKNFDVPFILARSAILEVVPGPFPVTKRYSTSPHLDLCELLSSFGSLRYESLDGWCQAFGIRSPKSGIDGSQVQTYFEAGRLQEIAEYCLQDVRATAELFERVRRYLLDPREAAERSRRSW